MEGQLATALAELHCLQVFEANQQEIIEQVHKLIGITSLQRLCVTFEMCLPDALHSSCAQMRP